MRVIASSDSASYSWRQRPANNEFNELMLGGNYVPKNKEEMEELRQVHQRQQVKQQVPHTTQHQTQSQTPTSPHGNLSHRWAYQRSSSLTQTTR